MVKRAGFKLIKFGICNVKRNLSKILIFLIPLTLLSQEWRFDPDSLRDDGPIVPMLINPLIDGIVPEKDYSTVEEESGKVYNGFRVQVLSTNSGARAENIRMKLVSQINHNVRVIFEAPNYKVRVGAFTDRKDAERLRKQLFDLGYRRSWIVRAQFTLQDS